MSEEQDPILQHLFAETYQPLPAKQFTVKVMRYTRDLKLKAFVRWGVLALITFLGGLYFFSDILLQLIYVVTRALTIEIVALDSSWMRWMFAPINTVGSLIIVTFGIARRFRQRFMGLGRSYAG